MAFLGIRIPHETGRLLSGIDVPGDKTDTSDLHITIVCFEKNWAVSEIAKALEATFEVVSNMKPFMIKINKIGSFPKRDNEPVAVIAKIKSDGLMELNKKIKAKFDDKDIEYSKLFKDYKPHVTLAYADDEVDEFKIDDAIEMPVQEIVLWGGDHGDDRIFITFPLKGPEKQKKSVLLQKADIFYKMAMNDPQEFFNSSFERRKNERQ